jgi:hypothetical protein
VGAVIALWRPLLVAYHYREITLLDPNDDGPSLAEPSAFAVWCNKHLGVPGEEFFTKTPLRRALYHRQCLVSLGYLEFKRLITREWAVTDRLGEMSDCPGGLPNRDRASFFIRPHIIRLSLSGFPPPHDVVNTGLVVWDRPGAMRQWEQFAARHDAEELSKNSIVTARPK